MNRSKFFKIKYNLKQKNCKKIMPIQSITETNCSEGVSKLKKKEETEKEGDKCPLYIF